MLPGAAFATASEGAFAKSAGSSVDLVIAGTISANCTVGGGGTIDLGQLDADKRVSASFDLGCNVPFEIIFRSASGGIAHSEKPEGEGPYAGIVPYRLGVTVPTLSPLPDEMTASFTSAQMMQGGSLDSGEAIAAGGGEIYLQTENIADRELLAGRYADSISVVINPRV